MSVFAAATGIGSWPGSEARPAAEVVVGELHTLTHLVELPARGVGADLIGRAGAMLVDIGIDVVPRGYRIAPGRSSVLRRAVSFLDEDVDALEEAWDKAGLRGGSRTVKIQAAGPITLAAHLELANGHRAITDGGAVRDLAGSLAEGIAAHRALVARRLDASVVVQLDEPSLPAALAGRLSGVSGLSSVHPVDEPLAQSLLDEVVATIGGEVVLHCCAPDLPWNTLRRSELAGVSVDVATLTVRDLDGIGEFVESGRVVMLGVVPAVVPAQVPSAPEVAKHAASITDRLGFPRAVLRDRIGITPACGLGGATAEWARAAVELAQKVADGIGEDPDSA